MGKKHGKELVQDAQAARQENNGDDGDAQAQTEKQDAGEAAGESDSADRVGSDGAAAKPEADGGADADEISGNAATSIGEGDGARSLVEELDPADDEQLAAHEGATIYEDEWNACLTMAFKGQGRDVLADWGNVPFVMAQFIMDNLDAPDEAVLMQVKLKEKVDILPNEDPRLVLLAVKLFRTYLLGWHAIDRADGEARRIQDADAQYLARTPEKLDLTDTPYETVSGPFDATSDLAKAAAARGTEA